MVLKAEFRRRFVRLNRCIDRVLQSDSEGCVRVGNLFPYLFSVFSIVWSNKTDSLFKKF